MIIVVLAVLRSFLNLGKVARPPARRGAFVALAPLLCTLLCRLGMVVVFLVVVVVPLLLGAGGAVLSKHAVAARVVAYSGKVSSDNLFLALL